jgi:putative SOS response-associated peptidase YedK
MPVIIPEQHHATWLGETDNENLKELLVPYPADQKSVGRRSRPCLGIDPAVLSVTVSGVVC